MLNSFNRNLSKVPLANSKLPEFWYSTYDYIGDIHDLLADELIRNNKILSYLKDNDEDSLDFLKTNLEDKLKALRNASSTQKRGYNKNDGVYMNFLSYEALKEFHDVLPLYLLQRSDIEKAKFGVDSVFYKDDSLWVFEFKTSTAQLKEQKTAKKIYEGVDSLLCKGDIKTASLFDCKTNIKNNNLNPKLLEIAQEFIKDRSNTERLLKNPNLVFNVCIISPCGVFTENEIKKYIKTEYIDCRDCTKNGAICKQYGCARFNKIKIFNAFHVQLPTEFSLEKLYDKLIEKLKGDANGKKE